jgi:hypothetical protein
LPEIFETLKGSILIAEPVELGEVSEGFFLVGFGSFVGDVLV